MTSEERAVDRRGAPRGSAGARGVLRFLKLAWRFKNGTTGAVIVLLVAFVAIAGQSIAPHDPFAIDLERRFTPPFWLEGGGLDHILGTDQIGRDILSRIIYASRWSVMVGVFAVVVAMAIGVPLGIAAAFYGRYVDAAAMFLVNVVMAFPFIVFALSIIAFVGAGFFNLVIVLGIGGWVAYTRVVRSEVFSLRERDFVIASQAVGGRGVHIMRVHLLANVMDSVIILASTQVAAMILAEAFLSFLGFGIQPPTPSWGGMLADARAHMSTRPWLATFPGLAIFVTVFGVNLLADGVRDFLDPKTRR